MIKGESQAIRFLKKFGGVQFAYLFGSAAKGHTPVDIDVAVLFDRLPSPLLALSLRNKISDGLGACFGKDVDVVILNNCNPFLKHQVLKYGRPLFMRSSKADAKFRYLTISEYFDALPLHNFFVGKMNGERRKYHG